MVANGVTVQKKSYSADALSLLTRSVTGNDTTRFTYDGTDAAGKQEHRRVPTKVDVTAAGSTWTSIGARATRRRPRRIVHRRRGVAALATTSRGVFPAARFAFTAHPEHNLAAAPPLTSLFVA